MDKLAVLAETFRLIDASANSGHCWSMDDLFPVFQYVVVRAQILQLGAELHMMEDLLAEDEEGSGEHIFMFTTLQAAYYQLLKESLSL